MPRNVLSLKMNDVRLHASARILLLFIQAVVVNSMHFSLDVMAPKALMCFHFLMDCIELVLPEVASSKFPAAYFV